MSSKRNSQMFSIDDAFEEENTDAIRVYGATTTERSPLRPQSLAGSVAGADAVSVHIHEPPSSISVKPIIRGLSKLKGGGDDSVSKDSDSLITEEQEIAYDPSMPWFYHPKVRENWRMVMAAFFLLIIGLGLTTGGIVIMSLPVNGIQGAVFLFAGIICLTPGAYHLFYIYCAVKGKRGYDFYHLPLFN